MPDGRPGGAPREYSLVKTPRHVIILLLAAEGGPALTGSPFHLGVPHQARMLAPLPEVHVPGDSGPDLPGPADAQHLCENDVGKDEGSLRVPTPVEHPPPIQPPKSLRSGAPPVQRAWHTSSLIAQQAGSSDAAMQRRMLLPRSGATRRCDTGSLHRFPATTGAHVQG